MPLRALHAPPRALRSPVPVRALRRRAARGGLALVALGAALLSCSTTPQPTASPTRRSGTLPAAPKVCEGVPRGEVVVHHLESAVTGERERYRTYRSPGAPSSGPTDVLVLLHGASADETQWLDVGIASTADCLVSTGEVTSLLIVLVDGSSVEGDRGDAPSPMEQLVVDEVLPTVRRTYPDLAGRDGTSIGGISLGGGWALEIAAHRPDLFSAVGGHSPAARLTAEEARSLDAEGVRVWLDVGKDDGLEGGVARTEAILRDNGVDPMVLSSDGGHDRRYWSEHTEDYLRFYLRLW